MGALFSMILVSMMAGCGHITTAAQAVELRRATAPTVQWDQVQARSADAEPRQTPASPQAPAARGDPAPARSTPAARTSPPAQDTRGRKRAGQGTRKPWVPERVPRTGYHNALPAWR